MLARTRHEGGQQDGYFVKIVEAPEGIVIAVKVVEFVKFRSPNFSGAGELPVTGSLA
jgi:hypothetical protein